MPLVCADQSDRGIEFCAQYGDHQFTIGTGDLDVGPIVGSHATIAAKLDEVATIDGVKGVMCVFDDYPVATQELGERVMPLMASRS